MASSIYICICNLSAIMKDREAEGDCIEIDQEEISIHALGIHRNLMLFSSIRTQQPHLRSSVDADAYSYIRLHYICHQHPAHRIHGRVSPGKLLLRTFY